MSAMVYIGFCSQRRNFSVTSRVDGSLQPLQPQAEVPLEKQTIETRSSRHGSECWQYIRVSRDCGWFMECIRHITMAVSNRRHCQHGFRSPTPSAVSCWQGMFSLWRLSVYLFAIYNYILLCVGGVNSMTSIHHVFINPLKDRYVNWLHLFVYLFI